MNSALALASALLLVLLFPRFDLAFLAPVALSPLLIAAAREASPLRRFLMGEAAGFVYWFGVCYWIQFVLAVHGGMGEAGGWGVFLLFCLAKALHMAVFTALVGPLMRRWYAVPTAAALWTGLERTHGPLGFAWLTLGNAGIEMGVPMRLAPFTGVYGLSFVFAMLGAALAVVVLRRRRVWLLWLGILPPLYLLPRLPEPARATHSAVALQPNLPQSTSWTTTSARGMQESLVTLSLQSALNPHLPKPSLIVWPEAPGPLYYYTDPHFRGLAEQLARAARLPLLLGTVAYSENNAPLNSALLLSAEGKPVSRYDKITLVPFGEYVPPPFGFVNRITQEAGDFEPGSKVVVSMIDGHKAGTFICYESAFPHLVRRFANEGAEMLINITNDGYFGRSAARAQHLLLARMRAAENRRWVLRPTNDGITVSIDPAGRLIERTEPYQRSVNRLSFSWHAARTHYTMWGDWFAWSCLLIGLAAWGAALRPRYHGSE
ncbi:MAG: apolipoprotein N-acyltransferase [Acidobacteriia bacterium]|nr:apolipoprotein N-acyltransferase [Terriglobia bacterium]